MSYSWAKPDVKVVYVHALSGRRPTRKPLKYLGIYTIREVVVHPFTGELGLYLAEVTNAVHPIYGLEKGYLIKAFRPLITKTQEQDVAIFAHLLNTSRVDA